MKGTSVKISLVRTKRQDEQHVSLNQEMLESTKAEVQDYQAQEEEKVTSRSNSAEENLHG